MKAQLLNTFVTATIFLLAATAGRAQSVYSNAIVSLNPAGYWPMHEVEAAVQGDIETNYGTLGLLGTGYYPDWAVNSGAFQRGSPGALAGDSDPSVYFALTANSITSNTNSLYVPHTSPLSTLNPPFTVECWFKPTSVSSSLEGDIWSQNGFEGLNAGAAAGGTGTIGGIRAYWNTGIISIITYDSTKTANTTVEVTGAAPNQWYHLVVTCDTATNIDVYTNGVLVEAANGTTKYLPDSWTPFEVGSGRGNTRPFTVGSVDEVATYTTNLSAGDIARHYSDGTNIAPVTSYFEDVTNDNAVIYLRMDSSAYTAPAVATWPVLYNYGATNGVAVGNGVYSPGTMPGVVTSPIMVNPNGVPWGE